MKDFSFQGKVYLGTRLSGGKPGALIDVGDAPDCKVSLSVDSESRKESRSGQRLESAKLITGKSASLALTLNYFSAENLALGLYGTKQTVSGSTVSAESFPTGLVVGEAVVLEHGNVSSLVITDSAGTPATLTAGTDYVLDNAANGVVIIKNLGSYTQPFKAAYAYGDSVDVTMFTADPPQRYFLLDGINTITNERVKVRLYKVQLDPTSELSLINSSFGQLTLAGSVLYDDEAILDADLGPFGKIELPEAA
jgi:hypothetical protein